MHILLQLITKDIGQINLSFHLLHMTVSTTKPFHRHHYAILAGIVINFFIGVYLIIQTSPTNVSHIIEQLEIEKVWWPENYAKLQQVMASDSYKGTYSQNLDIMLLQIQWWDQEDPLLNTLEEDIATGENANETPSNEIIIPDADTTVEETRNDEQLQ